MVIILAILLLSGSSAIAGADGEDPYAEPLPNYLRQFEQEGRKVFVLERFDAAGELVGRSIEKLDSEIAIDGPVRRTIGGRLINLRGLIACPADKVLYNRVQRWSCVDAARDYADAVYNKRARVILCKTLLLLPAEGETIPASCFLLVGGNGEPYRTVNDDDSMVFLGLAAVGRTQEGRSRRPDLEESQSLSGSRALRNAD